MTPLPLLLAVPWRFADQGQPSVTRQETAKGFEREFIFPRNQKWVISPSCHGELQSLDQLPPSVPLRGAQPSPRANCAPRASSSHPTVPAK